MSGLYRGCVGSEVGLEPTTLRLTAALEAVQFDDT